MGCNDFEEPVRNAFYKLTEATVEKLDLDEHTLNKLRKVKIIFNLLYMNCTFFFSKNKLSKVW